MFKKKTRGKYLCIEIVSFPLLIYWKFLLRLARGSNRFR